MKIKNALRSMYRSQFALLLIAVSSNSLAAFQTYEGDQTTESNWRANAGIVKFENFEGYAEDTQLSSLPELGVGFEALAGGGYPNTYDHGGGTPYGPMHLANFPNGISVVNQWNDIVLRVLPDANVTAVGYWNGDAQADTLVATAYDSSNNVLGSVGAFKGIFAGFISDVPISRVVFDGNTGDGWNHLDGLQTNLAEKRDAARAIWYIGLWEGVYDSGSRVLMSITKNVDGTFNVKNFGTWNEPEHCGNDQRWQASGTGEFIEDHIYSIDFHWFCGTDIQPTMDLILVSDLVNGTIIATYLTSPTPYEAIFHRISVEQSDNEPQPGAPQPGGESGQPFWEGAAPSMGR